MDANCMTELPVNTQFDFFLGSWRVLQRVAMPDGSWREFPAQTDVARDLDGHVLVEHWVGETLLPWEGMTEPELRKSISVRAYDPVRREWNIHWIDTRNRKFIPTATGNFRDGRGEFLLEGGGARIVFSDVQPSSFHWQFDVLSGEEWQAKWVMEMTRR